MYLIFMNLFLWLCTYYLLVENIIAIDSFGENKFCRKIKTRPFQIHNLRDQSEWSEKICTVWYIILISLVFFLLVFSGPTQLPEDNK